MPLKLAFGTPELLWANTDKGPVALDHTAAAMTGQQVEER